MKNDTESARDGDTAAPAPRVHVSREGPGFVLLCAPVWVFLAMPGLHGGGIGTTPCAWMALVSILLCFAGLLAGFSKERGSAGWWVLRIYVVMSALAILARMIALP